MDTTTTPPRHEPEKTMADIANDPAAANHKTVRNVLIAEGDALWLLTLLLDTAAKNCTCQEQE